MIGKLKLLDIAIKRMDLAGTIQDFNVSMANIEEDKGEILEKAKGTYEDMQEEFHEAFRCFETRGMDLEPGMLDMIEGRTNPFN